VPVRCNGVYILVLGCLPAIISASSKVVIVKKGSILDLGHWRVVVQYRTRTVQYINCTVALTVLLGYAH
jgi:hypothetical protein